MKSHIWLILLCSYRKPFRYQRSPKIMFLYFILNFLLENLPMLRTRFCTETYWVVSVDLGLYTNETILQQYFVRNMGKVSNRKFNMKYKIIISPGDPPSFCLYIHTYSPMCTSRFGCFQTDLYTLEKWYDVPCRKARYVDSAPPPLSPHEISPLDCLYLHNHQR